MERIGRYEIIEEIGRGGFGRVYRGNDPLMKREVAIKVMTATDEPGMLGRFRNEAAAAGNLRHESIVTVYDLGEEQGVPYIVMEYLRGQNLQQVLDRRGPLALIDKVRILCQIASGLQTAHENGIIHRDVKPANIMVLKDGTVKITDFGIALLNREGVTRHTRAGFMVGTLQYLPPEQFLGHEPDAFADLWGFGVIAYQLLSGHCPFESPDPAQVIYLITKADITDLRKLSPGTPEDLCWVVNRMLQRGRSERYQSFEDIRIELNPILERLETQEAARMVDQARVLAARDDLTGSHQIVRQVLERYPSFKDARQLRDQIVQQMRAGEAKQQAQELVKNGDLELSAGRYEQAATIYEQASRMLPGSSTVHERLDRARDLADQARGKRNQLDKARASLGAGALHEAYGIATAILETDPGNQEARDLLTQINVELDRQREARAADAILRSRLLATSQRYDEAMGVLEACWREIGDHPALRECVEEVRQQAAERAEILSRQAATRERQAAARRVSADRAGVIAQALARSRGPAAAGDFSEAIRILDVALSLYPDAQDVLAERRRLSDAAVVAREPPPAVVSQPRPSDGLETVALPQPAKPVEGPSHETAPHETAPHETESSRETGGDPTAQGPRRTARGVMVAGIAASLLAAAGLTYWWVNKPTAKAPLEKQPAALAESHPVTTPSPTKATPDSHPAATETRPKAPEAGLEAPKTEAPKTEVPKSDGRDAKKSTKAPTPEPPAKVAGKTDKAAGSNPTGAGGGASSNPTQTGNQPKQPIVQAAPVPEPLHPPAAATQNSEPPPEPIAEWGGPKRGRVTWKGSLPPGGRLVLSASGVREGGGDITSGALPTVDMNISLDPPDANLRADGSGRHVVIVNRGSTPVGSITFAWSLK